MKAGRLLATAALTCAALLLCAATVCGQVPEKMNYQVMLTDDSDQPLADQTVNVDFRIYAVATGGPTLWAEAHNVTTNSIGVATVVLGSTNPLNIDFDVPLWLEIQVEDDILTPRRELMSSPYALYARDAEYAMTTGSVDSCAYADTAGYALATAGTDTALYAQNAGYADTAGYAMAAPCDTCDYAVAAAYADTAGYAMAAPCDTCNYAVAAGYADTAGYAMAAPCDTCNYALAAGSAAVATTAGSA